MITRISPEPPLERYVSKDKIYVGSISFNKTNKYFEDNPFNYDLKKIKHKTKIEHLSFFKKSNKNKPKKLNFEELQNLGKIE